MNAESTPNPLAPSSSGTPERVSESAVRPQTGPVQPIAIRLKKILTPIDFSEASKQALKYATAFASQFQGQLTLLHVVEFNYVGSEFGAVELSQIEAEMQENASKQLAEWSQHEVGGLVSAECLVRSGRPYAEIVEAANELGTDLIIIATHGHTSLAHVLLGSTVERVMRYAPCPVLIVRRQEREFVS